VDALQDKAKALIEPPCPGVVFCRYGGQTNATKLHKWVMENSPDYTAPCPSWAIGGKRYFNVVPTIAVKHRNSKQNAVFLYSDTSRPAFYIEQRHAVLRPSKQLCLPVANEAH
jgi:hypothetical protein